jgi:hypothetical protein
MLVFILKNRWLPNFYRPMTQELPPVIKYRFPGYTTSNYNVVLNMFYTHLKNNYATAPIKNVKIISYTYVFVLA